MFPKTAVAIRFNLLQVCPSVQPFAFAVIFIPSFDVFNAYFYISLSLLEVPTV